MNDSSDQNPRRAAPGSLEQMKKAIDQLHQGASSTLPTRKLQLLMRAMRRGRPGQQPDSLLSTESVQGVKAPLPVQQRDSLS